MAMHVRFLEQFLEHKSAKKLLSVRENDHRLCLNMVLMVKMPKVEFWL